MLPFLLSVYLHAASFNCAKARTPIEKAICASYELSMADDKLAQAYGAALAKAPDAADLVRASQREWLQIQATKCKPDDKNYPLADCLLSEWNDRIFFLGDIVQRKGSITFFFHEVSLEIPSSKKETGSKPNAGDSDDADPYSNPPIFHATWPEAISDKPEWQAWNKAVLDEARRWNSSQDNENEVPDHWVLIPDDTWHSDMEVSVEVGWVSSDLVTATIHREWTYAHPTYDERAFNWMLKQSRELKPNDLFQPDSDWKGKLRDGIGSFIAKGGSDAGWDKEVIADQASQAANSASATNPGFWQIDPKGLTIIFNPCDALCCTCGVDLGDFTIAWQDLKPYLSPNFKVPQ